MGESDFFTMFKFAIFVALVVAAFAHRHHEHSFIISKDVAMEVEATLANKTFTQKDCTNSACSEGCQSHSFPADTCLQVRGGGSAKAECQPPYLVEKIWTNSDCSGNPAQTGKAPLNKCLQASTGGYFENLCN